ncbi:roadblock/LC7 domain-containing protein [Nocardia wallacei]|uniref:roadblock/LC7 domain-containing protein n=1 Tax=Nocardia wallacei TaxID=480035 RepID=UPI002456DD48|nr:roadblock/LC7 domain-containing protein [Nocardia wallacei]
MSEQRIQRKEIRLGDSATVARLLTAACTSIGDAQYAFVTSRDGLVIASGNALPSIGQDEDEVAMRGSALAAAAAGIGDHFAALSAHGRLQSAFFEADRGCVAVVPLSSTLLLVVGSAPAVSLGRLTAAARKIVATLHAPNN